MTPGTGRQSGMTLVEVSIAAAVALGVIAAVAVLVNSIHRGSAAEMKRNAMSARAAEVTERIVRELAVSGVRGEDEDGDGAIDAGEDGNVNGRLDADWSLPDGASASSVTFNVLERGAFTWSGPCGYLLQGDVLVRTQNGATVEFARGVQSFDVARTGQQVTVSLVLAGTDSTGQPWTESAERRVYVRN